MTIYTKLSVNINKIATIRNARGGDLPNVVKIAVDCERFGADGITVHPRPDGRHIRYQDVIDIKNNIKKEFNIEGYPSESFIELVLKVKPAQVTLVPDPPDALTSNNGWDIKKNQKRLKEIIKLFKENNIRTSLFVNPDCEQIEYAAKVKTNRIELYTESYAKNYYINKKIAIEPFCKAAECAVNLGLEVNSGHDLNLANLNYLVKTLKVVSEVSIGHALISDALYYGLQNTIQMYKKQLVF